MGAEVLIAEIRAAFAEVSEKLNEWMCQQAWTEEDQMHAALLEQFSQITSDAISENETERAQKYLEFMALRYERSDEMDKAFIATYFVAPLMWNDRSAAGRERCWTLMSKDLRRCYRDFWGRTL